MLTQIHSYKKRRKQQIYAGLFGVFLFVFMTGSLTIACTSVDSLILGTELNGNGTVEYLCLGGSCENLQAMDW